MSPTRVLAAVDGSPITDIVLAHTTEVAKSMPDAEIHIVHAVEVALIGGVESGVVPLTVSLVEEKKYVQKVASDLSQRIGRHVYPHLRVDTAWHGIVQAATDIEATLLIVGTHDRRGLSRLLVGSVTDVVVRSAPCAVYVARERVAHRSDVPSIEPPCPDCLAVRKATSGKDYWCERHHQHHGRAHVYSDGREGFGAGAEFFKELASQPRGHALPALDRRRGAARIRPVRRARRRARPSARHRRRWRAAGHRAAVLRAHP